MLEFCQSGFIDGDIALGCRGRHPSRLVTTNRNVSYPVCIFQDREQCLDGSSLILQKILVIYVDVNGSRSPQILRREVDGFAT